MFNKKDENLKLESVIETLLIELDNDHDKAHTEDYAKRVDQIAKLYALKTNESKTRISSDALITAGANLAGILIIVGYEQKNLLASKALGFLRRV